MAYHSRQWGALQSLVNNVRMSAFRMRSAQTAGLDIGGGFERDEGTRTRNATHRAQRVEYSTRDTLGPSLSQTRLHYGLV
jgi:hypothetical protein